MNCLNCKYSIYCNNRWLCIKQGITINEAEATCSKFEDRFPMMYAEPDPEIVKSFIYADTDSVKVVKPKVKGLKSRLRIFYYKWIKGNCRHFCKFCKYTNDCLDEIDYIANRSGKF